MQFTIGPIVVSGRRFRSNMRFSLLVLLKGWCHVQWSRPRAQTARASAPRATPGADGSGSSAVGVRRAKAALSSGCKPHPATAPAGSNRSSYGGDEIAEAFGMRATNWWQRECAGRNASERRASLEKDNAQADLTAISGKADTTG